MGQAPLNAVFDRSLKIEKKLFFSEKSRVCKWCVFKVAQCMVKAHCSIFRIMTVSKFCMCLQYFRCFHYHTCQYCKQAYRNDPKFSDGQVWANSVDPDQTAPTLR